ncbi:hypothetical protein F2Q69_00001955 [Brassica cretica]|uniref:Pentacotripeptide-repeat region of PRORP domain-containing protein n=1 Tax=Brassica cretica TaxID=69181 RepID=A0A8S9P292_BRACR|nr:hypothetical protein F2Q69_00001955 [Brassica cretica]
MPVTSTALLRMLRECRTLRCILQVHGKLTVSGLKPHNQLINAYSLFQRPNLSRIIFDSVQDPGVVLCNSMIRGYTRAGLHREALELFRYMSEEKSIVPDKYSFTFALKACTGALDLERGLGIHELVSEMGFESDVYIGTALVEMYCKGGDLVRAREVFDEMPERDVVTWNIMVSGLVQNGCFGEALRLFRDMCLSCVEIDHVSLYNLIPAVSKIGSKDVCRCLHGLVVKKGFAFGFSSGLIDMYCKCADLDAAECVFEDVWSKDDSSWGAMMAAYAHNGCFTKVLELSDIMRCYDVRMNKSEIPGSKVSLMSIPNMLWELALMSAGYRTVQYPGVVLCNSMIRGYTRAGLHREALELFRYMSEEKGIVPDKYSLAFALKACTGASDLERGLGIHELVSEMGFESDVYIGTALVEMYCKGGDLVRARDVFDEMPERDGVTWNVMVSGVVQNGCFGKALRLFRDMCLSGAEIDHKGFASGFSSGLIDMYCKCADLDAAECVFEDVWSKDDSSWGTMMAAYAHNGCFTKVLELFDVMRSYDVKTNKVAVVSALQAAAYLGELEKGIRIHEFVVQQGMMDEVSVATSLVSMYSKCGELEIAEQLFTNITDRDVVTWSAMIASFHLAGHHDDARSLFRDMMKTDVKPNAAALTSVLPACAGIAAASRLGKSVHCYAIKADIDSELAAATDIISIKAFDVYHNMKLHGVFPDSGTMVGLLQTCALCSNYDQGSCVYGQTIKHGFDSECQVAHALLDMFTKCHALSAAKSLFDKCGFEKSTVSWNIMMNGYLINGQAEEAIAAFRQKE